MLAIKIQGCFNTKVGYQSLTFELGRPNVYMAETNRIDHSEEYIIKDAGGLGPIKKKI